MSKKKHIKEIWDVIDDINKRLCLIEQGRMKKYLKYEEKSNLIILEKNSNKEITSEMEKEIEDSLNWFYSRTFGGHVIKYLNGFVGVGILTIPSDHLTKGANEIWHYQIGSNTRGTGIEEIINVEMDIEEAEDTLKCFKICIDEYNKKVLEE